MSAPYNLAGGDMYMFREVKLTRFRGHIQTAGTEVSTKPGQLHSLRLPNPLPQRFGRTSKLAGKSS